MWPSHLFRWCECIRSGEQYRSYKLLPHRNTHVSSKDFRYTLSLKMPRATVCVHSAIKADTSVLGAAGRPHELRVHRVARVGDERMVEHVLDRRIGMLDRRIGMLGLESKVRWRNRAEDYDEFVPAPMPLVC